MSTGSTEKKSKAKTNRLSLTRQRAEKRREKGARGTSLGVSVGQPEGQGGATPTGTIADAGEAGGVAMSAPTAVAAAAPDDAENMNTHNTKQPQPQPRQQPQPPYMRTYVDPDALSAFQLRTSLSRDIPFMHLWHVLESQGWRHNDAKYYTPRGVCLGSAIEVFRVLDGEGGMPERSFGLAQSTSASASAASAASSASMRKLRDDLLEGYYRYQHYMEHKKKKKRKRVDSNNGKEEKEPGAKEENEGNNITSSARAVPDGGDDDGDSLGPALFGIDSDCSPVKTPGSSKSLSSRSTVPRRSPRHHQPHYQQQHPKQTATNANRGGGGDRGAEEYMRNKVGMPAAVARRQTRRRAAVEARTRMTAAAEQKPQTKKTAVAAAAATAADNASPSGNDADANNDLVDILADDDAAADDDDEPEHHVWPNLETNVSSVRNYAVSIASETGVQALDDDYVSHFDEWRYLLSTNHSVLLHGFGSKRSLLNDFAETVLPHDGDVLTLDGYDRTIGIEGILTALVHLYLGGHEPRPRSLMTMTAGGGTDGSATRQRLGIVTPSPGSPAVVRRAWAIAERIASTRESPIYLVLHNIDGVGLRTRPTQDALAMLVAAGTASNTSKAVGMRMIRLISSVDHVNAPATLWSTQTRAAFGWAWKEVHTYRPSFEEVRLGGEEGPARKTRYGSTLGGGARTSASSNGDGMGFMRVLESIGKRHTEALQVLAREQYKLMKEQERKPQQQRRGKPAQITIAYSTWKQLCMAKMCASDETGLRNMLTELTDHGIIATKFEDDGRHLFIPHNLPVLKQILKFKPDAD